MLIFSLADSISGTAALGLIRYRLLGQKDYIHITPGLRDSQRTIATGARRCCDFKTMPYTKVTWTWRCFIKM